VKGRALKNTLVDIIDETKLSLCIECGKCVAGCPLADIYEYYSYEYSARGIIRKTLLGIDILGRKEIWFCLRCDICAEVCPAGVKYAEFIDDIRQLALRRGVSQYCSFCERCGRCYLPLPTRQHIGEVLAEKEESDEFLKLCPECRRHGLARLINPPIASRE